MSLLDLHKRELFKVDNKKHPLIERFANGQSYEIRFAIDNRSRVGGKVGSVLYLPYG